MMEGIEPQWKRAVDAAVEAGRPVTAGEVCAKLGNVNPKSILRALKSACVNDKGRTHYQGGAEPRRTDTGHSHDRLFRQPDRRYVPYDPKVHGVWEVYSDPASRSSHKTSVRELGKLHPRMTVTLTNGAVKPGNTFFPIKAFDEDFFPPSMIRAKDPDAPAVPARFTTDAGTEFHSDVYRSSPNSGYLHNRAAASAYYLASKAKGGDRLRFERKAEDHYHITLLPAVETAEDSPEQFVSEIKAMVKPINKILYGPPGTGKTYHTVNEALEILDPQFKRTHAGERKKLKQRYDELVAEQRIRFVTFHQSFSYEDFVEGIRAESEGGQLKYSVKPGVFRAICEDAGGSAQVASEVGVRENARIWKISIDGTGATSTSDYCLSHGEARIGWDAVGDLKNEHLSEVPAYSALGANDRSTLQAFSREIEPGDVLLCIGSETDIQAIGVVQGEYEFQPAPPPRVRRDYVNVLPVKWVATGLKLDIRPINGGRMFTLRAVYELTRFGWPELSDYLESASITLQGAEADMQSKALPHVLIIDEINRGNVSRIFGELITLIEPSKRKGEAEAMEVELPYSRKKFSVPRNVYLIGTMNTADRSLSGLDVALRRRFEFVEMLPDPDALGGVVVDGVPVDALLATMNRRIEVLLGRDYMLGHAYFMGLKEDPSLVGLAEVFRRQVLPLLQEYFFEDWQKIAWVLNDHRKPEALCFLQRTKVGMAELLGNDIELPGEGRLWTINHEAFDNFQAYLGIIKAPQVVA